MAFKKEILFACVAAVVVASPVLAQRWGRDGFPRDGVCFFKNPNFEGEYFCVRSGENLGSMPSGMNDRISSLRVFGRAEVTVFKDVRFEGRSSRFESDIPNLRNEGWNDLISSIRVRSSSGGGFGNNRPGRPSFGRPSEDPDRIVRRAYQDVLEREPDSAGLRMYRGRIIDDGWTESQVRDALRNSAEYREKSTMTVAKAQEMVRRAYLSVLKREPDAQGSQGYINRILRDHWSQQDVERELRKSPEYRNKG